jgi:hypothetical protein
MRAPAVAVSITAIAKDGASLGTSGTDHDDVY